MTVDAAAKGTATITATLCDSSGTAITTSGSAITDTAAVTVSDSNLFTLYRTNPTDSTVYLNYYGYYDGYYDGYYNGYYDGYYNGYYYRNFEVTPYLNGVASANSIRDNSDYTIRYVWTLNGYEEQNTVTSASSRSGYSYTLSAGNIHLNRNSYSNTLTCTAYVLAGSSTPGTSVGTYSYSGSVSWTVRTDRYSSLNPSVTVYDSNPGYGLRDTPDVGSTSIADQIDSWVRSYYYGYNYSSYYDYYTVRIPGGTRNSSGGASASGNYGTLTSSYSSSWLSYSDLDKIVFTPVTSVTTANGSYSVSFPFEVRLYYYNTTAYDHTVSGTMTFTVKQGTATGGNISYAGLAGKEVTFNVSDFESFWTSRYPSGYLTSVVFSSPTGTPSGTVYNSGNKAVGSTSQYVSPSSSQSGLSGVYFSPASSRTGTVSIRFTATGQTTNSSNSSYKQTLSGTVVITYLSTAASRITYTTNSSGTVALSAQDFISAYKSAVNTSSNPSNLTIQFQEVPAYGFLAYTGGSRDVSLTDSNVKSYKFSTGTSGSNRIGDVIYSVSGSRNDTISYIGYIGNTATFTGEVTFNAVTTPANVSVTYSCTSAAGITLTPANFTGAHSAMSSAYYVTLGTPRTGTLSYTGGLATNPILINSLNSVTYKPGASVTGVAADTFSFNAYDSNSNLIASGTVAVSINLPASSAGTGAITDISQFTDVPAAGGTADWYRTPLIYLINKGVINGQGGGKFGPEAEVEYSAALKFILNAAGIVETEVNTPGVNWAQNYKNRAVNAGWISSDVDLTKPIGRDAMVELTAKVLGVPASSAVSPFTDSSNQWAVALYNTTPRIITGSNDLSGKLVFQPNEPLRRDAMICIVYRMYQYRDYGTQYGTTGGDVG